ncbi:MAG: Na/Pi cotransporter family protein, partial [Acholeplasmataceae bacterium]
MSDSLKLAAGNKLKMIIEKSTNTPLKGIFVGILLTMLIQSSSGTTALMIGLVRSGLMTLPQSVGIIMGANIGTTVTAFIIALPIADYGLYFIFIGVLMYFFKQKRVKHFGGVLIGLGMLFFGLDTMSAGLKPLASTATAYEMFSVFSQNWFLGSLFGTLFTMLIQSSSAAIGILQYLYALNAEGVQSISLNGAIPILLGANVGTTITALLASIGGNTESKRASFIHILFNLVSLGVFLIILLPYEHLVAWFENKFLTQYSRATIAFAHAFQNVAMTFLLYWFIKPMIKLAKIVVKDDKNKLIPDNMFDEKLIDESPLIALEFVQKTVLYMGSVVKDYLAIVQDYSHAEKNNAVHEGYIQENILDTYNTKLHDYLIKISQSGLDKINSSRLSRDLDTIKDFERIGDHLTNILDFFVERYEEDRLLTPEGTEELDYMFSILNQMLVDTLYSFEKQDILKAKEVIKKEDLIDELEEVYRYRHIERLKQGEIKYSKAENYVDILANLERIGDHLMNIASSIIEPLYIPQDVIIPKPKEIDKDI